MTTKEIVKLSHPSARLARQGIKYLIVCDSNGIAGWKPLSGMHYNEDDAWNEVAWKENK